MDDESDRAWRGRIRVLLYGMRLAGPIDPVALDRRVEDELRRRRAGHDPDETYGAVVAALRSGAALAEEGQEEGAVRDALRGIVQRLDALRPWPPEPFREQDVQRWRKLRTNPVVGRIPLSMIEVEAAFALYAVPAEPGERTRVLVLRMLSGESVALRQAGAWGDPFVEVFSSGEPAAVRAEITAATGLAVDLP
jgi:hypothetical protein